MTKTITQTVSFFLLIITFLSIAAQNVQAQDSTFKPGGKLWGLAFADYFYKSHADSAGRGSYQYSKIPKNTNAFQYRRIYLGYNYDISPSFSVEVLLAAENDVQPSTGGVSTGTAGDVLQDNSFAPYIKYANLRWKNIWKGTDLVVGQQATPLASQISEPAWGYRSIEKTISDFNKSNTYDLGVSLQGRFDPGTDNFGYDLMVGNGTKAVPESDNYKWLYGDIWGKFLNKKLWVDLYIDYNKIGYVGSTLNYPESRNMIKATVAYVTTPFSIGVEAFTNSLKNNVQGYSVSGTTKDTTTLDATGEGVSIYARGSIIKNKLGFFARYDAFNPDSKYDNTTYSTYLKPTGNVYDPNTKTQFLTAGFDITPTKNVHFMPNVWYARYSNQQANLTGSYAHDYDLVWRMTFYFVFGK